MKHTHNFYCFCALKKETSWAELGAQSRLKQLDCKDFLSQGKIKNPAYYAAVGSSLFLRSYIAISNFCCIDSCRTKKWGRILQEVHYCNQK